MHVERTHLLPVVLAATALLLPGAASSAPFAYVPNEKSATVSVIDTATDQVVASVDVGVKPRGIAVSADGKLVYVSDARRATLWILDAATRAVAGEVEVGE